MAYSFRFKVGDVVGPSSDKHRIIGLYEADTDENCMYALESIAGKHGRVWASAEALDEEGESGPIPPPPCEDPPC